MLGKKEKEERLGGKEGKSHRAEFTEHGNF